MLLSRWGDWISINHLPEGIAIYTWIIGVEEGDERMLAIKEGKSGEDKLKKYDPFASSVVSAGGFLDVSKLVDPHVPSGMTLSQDQTSKSVDSSPISTPSPQLQPESKDQSPLMKQTTPTSHLVAPPSQPVHPLAGKTTTSSTCLTACPHSRFHDTTAATRRGVSYDYKSSSQCVFPS